MPTSREALDYLSPELMAEAQARWQPADPAGLALAGFLASPSVGLGLVADSNPFQRHAGGPAAFGLRLRPRLVAERENGLHATVFYGTADARLYPAAPDADQLDGRIGVLHDWAPRRDMIVRVQGELSQARDAIDDPAVVEGRARRQPFTVREATLATSVQKTFGATALLTGSADVVHSAFTDGRAGNGRGVSDQTGTDLAVRGGYRLGSALVLFAEPSVNWRTLDEAPDRASGTRLVAGLAIERVGLLGGDLFAGYQHQSFSRYAAQDEPVFGGRLAWWPTPAWTATVAIDRRLEQAAVGTAAEPLGTPIDVAHETATVRYQPSQSWSAEAALEHAGIRYLTTHREDDLLGIGAVVTVAWRHDVDLSADLHLIHVTSTIAAASYDRATATLGALYRY